MNVGLFPISAKPYHVGHHSVMEIASKENDQVVLFVSLSDRKRKGEFPVSGESMRIIWDKHISPVLPENVRVRYVVNPVRSIYEMLESASASELDTVFTVYSDNVDINRNFPDISRNKYFPRLHENNLVRFKGVERGKDSPDVSGTKMRAALQCGDKLAFKAGCVPRMDSEEIFNILCSN